MTPTRALATAAALVALTSGALPAEAQRRLVVTGLHVGSGLSMGTGPAGENAGSVTLRRTPIFLEAEAHTWIDAAPDPVLGAARRLEVDGRVSVAVVPRAGLVRPLGPARLRLFAGAPFFFAPFSMLGAEVGAALAIPLGDRFALSAGLRLDVFFWGSDLPSDTALVDLDLAVGLEVRL